MTSALTTTALPVFRPAFPDGSRSVLTALFRVDVASWRRGDLLRLGASFLQGCGPVHGLLRSPSANGSLSASVSVSEVIFIDLIRRFATDSPSASVYLSLFLYMPASFFVF